MESGSPRYHRIRHKEKDASYDVIKMAVKLVMALHDLLIAFPHAYAEMNIRHENYDVRFSLG